MRETRPYRVRPDGFTLVEVVISVLLITVLMIPITRLGYMVMRSTQYARDVGEALAAGQTQLETFEGMDFAAIQTGSGSSGKYDLAWTVTRVDGNKVVELDVAWSILGREITLDLNTVYSPRTPSGFRLP